MFSAFTTLHSSLSRSLDLFAFRGFSIAKCGKQEFIFFSLLFPRCYSLELLVNRPAKYPETIPTTCERDRCRRCIIADRRSWIIQDYASASSRHIISRLMPSASNFARNRTTGWFIPLEPRSNKYKRRKKVVFRFFLLKRFSSRDGGDFFPQKFFVHFSHSVYRRSINLDL